MSITQAFIAGRLLPLRCIKEEAGKQERRQKAGEYEERTLQWLTLDKKALPKEGSEMA